MRIWTASPLKSQHSVFLNLTLLGNFRYQRSNWSSDYVTTLTKIACLRCTLFFPPDLVRLFMWLLEKFMYECIHSMWYFSPIRVSLFRKLEARTFIWLLVMVFCSVTKYYRILESLKQIQFDLEKLQEHCQTAIFL